MFFRGFAGRKHPWYQPENVHRTGADHSKLKNSPVHFRRSGLYIRDT